MNEDDIAAALLEPPPETKPKEPKRKSWRPKSGPIGQQIFRLRSVPGRPEDVLVKILYGERGSLKTGILLNDLVIHCHSDVAKPQAGMPNLAPLAVICTIFRSAATEGGAWEKLHSLVLPEWRDGIGLDFTEPKQDDQKNRYCFIGHKYGGWSRVILKSIPYGENIRGRLKGIEPSYFFSDEITEQSGPDYFFVPFQQLRRPTRAPRIFVAACNPADTGEDHWVWKNMVMIPCKTAGNKEPELPTEKVNFRADLNRKYSGGLLKGLDEQFKVFHVPVEENVYWNDEQIKAYQNTVLAEARHDKSAIDRLIFGKWTPRPTGEGIFKDYFRASIHVKGDAAKRTGLLPKPGFPLVIGYDLGQVYHSVNILQRIPTIKSSLWLLIDEIDVFNKRVLYLNLAKEIMERMRWWRARIGYPFKFMHVTDESAINQFRPGGTAEAWNDATTFEREYNKYQKELGVTGEPIRLLGCPKGPGSIAARVQLLQSKLYQEELFISATCPNAKDMFMFLEADKKNPENPKETSKYTHKFDGLSYPIFKIDTSPDARINLPTEPVAPSLISCG